MAAVKGVNVTRFDAGGGGDNDIDQGLIHAGIEAWTDSFEAAALVAASTIDIAELPDGAKVHRIDVYHDALGAATIDVGDSDDPDRYTLAPADVSSAGTFSSDTADGTTYQIGTNTGDSRVQLTTASAAITGTIKTVIYYTR